VHRILANGTDLGNITGRLVDELFAVEAQKKGAASLARGPLDETTAKKVEFWPGSEISDLHNEQLTDGILGYLEGDDLHVLNIFEAKAGQRRARSLIRLEQKAAELSQADIAEIRNAATDFWADEAAEAKALNQPFNATPEQIENYIRSYRVQTDVGGQLRASLERLDYIYEMEGTRGIPAEIYLNRRKVNVVGISGDTAVTGVLPSDVKFPGMRLSGKETLQTKTGLNLGELHMPFKQEKIDNIALAIKNAAEH
jgi:hypothetical protein